MRDSALFKRNCFICRFITLAFLLILIIPILSACGSREEEGIVWKTYTDLDYGYSIGYPSTFEIESIGDGLILMHSRGYEYGDMEAVRITIITIKKGKTLSFASLSSAVNSHLESKPKTATHFYELIKCSELLWQNTYPAYEIKELVNMPDDVNTIIEGKNLYVEHNNYIYDVISAAEQSVYESNLSTIDTITNSFQLSN